MFLLNKHSGKVEKITPTKQDRFPGGIQFMCGNTFYYYSSIKALNKDWEDVPSEVTQNRLKYVSISTEDLKSLLNLATTYPYDVFCNDDNTDGEGKWHCDVEFYDELGDETPTETFSFNESKGEKR